MTDDEIIEDALNLLDSAYDTISYSDAKKAKDAKAALVRLVAEKERAERERDEAREREEATRQANLDTMDWFNSLKADYDSLTARLRSVCEALDEINMMACYASEEDVNSREWMLLKIGETTRAALDAAKKEMGE